jgi:WD40 repeat protein
VLKVWDWEYGLCVRTLLSHTYAVWGLGVTSMTVNNKKEPLLGSASWDKSVKVWQLKKLELPQLKARQG